ncbi:GNAT family N-acetyltransferase [Iodidimonas sp. SYSU 1G8]|uniref:GNAT family N-acetyltransferase n=1 Tax=Iodidimonas sp. SYSU 1G8 TaxID=3133967 RepID=UPI0031FEECFD
MNDLELAWRMERACRNAWPAPRSLWLDGWVLNLAGSLGRRINSVNALGPAPGPVAALVPVAERFYASHGQPAIFRVTDLIGQGLDQRLDDAGYTTEGRTLTLHAAIAARTMDAAVTITPEPDAAWLMAMSRLQDQSPDTALAYHRIVRSIAAPSGFAAFREDGQYCALAYGTVSEGLLCLESVVTDAAWRRRGAAARLIRSLMGWGASQGAAAVCLQVMADNVAGQALYRSLGMGEPVYRYHYRRQPGER